MRFLISILAFSALTASSQIPFRPLMDMERASKINSPQTTLGSGLQWYLKMEESGVAVGGYRTNSVNIAGYIGPDLTAIATNGIIGSSITMQEAPTTANRYGFTTLGGSAGMNFCTNFSYSLNWWQYNLYTYNAAFQRKTIGQYDGTTYEFAVFTWDNGNWYVGHLFPGNDMRMSWAATANDYPQFTWIMYTLTWTNNAVPNFYTNGVLYKTGAKVMTNAPAVMQAACFFGAEISTDPSTRSGHCRIDEFGFWNRILTQPEITQLYNGGLGFRPPGLVY